MYSRKPRPSDPPRASTGEPHRHRPSRHSFTDENCQYPLAGNNKTVHVLEILGEGAMAEVRRRRSEPQTVLQSSPRHTVTPRPHRPPRQVYRGVILPDNIEVAVKFLKEHLLREEEDASLDYLRRPGASSSSTGDGFFCDSGSNASGAGAGSGAAGGGAPRSNRYVQDFLSEVQVQRSLYDPHIVNYFGHIRTADALGLVMELCGGGTLRDRVRRDGPLRDEAEIARVLRQVLQAMHMLLQNKVVHR